jgi:hypothetical protein
MWDRDVYHGECGHSRVMKTWCKNRCLVGCSSSFLLVSAEAVSHSHGTKICGMTS